MIKNLVARVFRLVASKFYWNSTVKELNLDQYEGKSIAIVGGADSAFYEENGEYIDSFDVVIRVNRGIDNLNGNERYLGTKTTLLFHGLHEDPINGCGPVRPMLWHKMGVEHVVFPLIGQSEHTELLKTFVSRSKGSLSIMQISEPDYFVLKNELEGFRTTTGFAAIYLASKIRYSKMFVTGFTFFRTPHQSGYIDSVRIEEIRSNIKERNFHNPDVEFELFKKLYSSRTNIEIDKPMKDLM
ncbi:glycosyltransferase family 29 protein [Sphingobacterium hotanense]|uniref:glycosyltransferase family 29 protein n=1 Tax=Sphingobacterium hotanense TaxID=649196 RepID=UPI0021A6B821|nr:glycosyltransferase family 29 protein [Sphingobacterium hotanense]MCT1526946.1 glycosyltransferase family 29 protein [Sphingobacterium hotanense]